MWIGLLPLVFLAPSFVQCRSDVAISAPDIYPDSDEPFIGDVSVRIVSNAPHSFTVYTLDGSEPRNTSTMYTEPILLFKPNVYTVSARAFPDSAGRGASATVTRKYTVVQSDADPPQLTPPPGTYRQRVSLRPSKPIGQKSVMLYAVNPPADQDTRWLEYSDDHDIVLDVPGDFSLLLVVVDRSDRAKKVTPMARYHYIVKAPLVYDVSTECTKCSGPTVGEPFTVWLQNVKPQSTMFLSTTSHGCERRSHRLDDTVEVPVGVFKPYAHFNTLDDDTTVYVCVSEDGVTFDAVQNRRTGSQQPFKLAAPLRPVVRTTNPPAAQSDAGSGADMSSGLRVTAWDIVIGILACLGAVMLVREGSKHASRFIHTP